MKLQYTGTSDVRTIAKSEWPKELGDQDAVKWDRENKFTAEVSEEAGQWLLEHEAGEWKEVTEEPKKVSDKDNRGAEQDTKHLPTRSSGAGTGPGAGTTTAT